MLFSTMAFTTYPPVHAYAPMQFDHEQEQYQDEITAEESVEAGADDNDIIALINDTFDDERMISIAICESGLDPKADRGNKGIDLGLFQINQVHSARLNGLGLDPLNIEDNITYAHILYKESGIDPWFMSYPCLKDFGYTDDQLGNIPTLYVEYVTDVS